MESSLSASEYDVESVKRDLPVPPASKGSTLFSGKSKYSQSDQQMYLFDELAQNEEIVDQVVTKDYKYVEEQDH